MSNLLNLRDAVDLYIGDTRAIALYLGNNKLYHPVPDVLLWLKVINTPSGTIIKDFSQYNRAITGSTHSDVIDGGTIKCGSNGSMYFNASNRHILIANNGGITNTDILNGGITIEWWQNTRSDLRQYRGIWQLDNNGSHTDYPTELGKAFTVNQSTDSYTMFNTTEVSLPSYLNTWNHFAVILRKSDPEALKPKVYINGSDATSDLGAYVPTLSGGNLCIGNIGANTTDYAGANIDSFRITKGHRYTNNFTPNETTTLLNYTSDLS